MTPAATGPGKPDADPGMPGRAQLLEHLTLFISVVKWTLYATVVGVLRRTSLIEAWHHAIERGEELI